MKIKYYILFFLLSAVSSIISQNIQDENLAREYYRQGEFQKAATLFGDIYKKKKVKSIYDKYVDCLIKIESQDIMELNELKPAKGAVKSRKRVGRGEGSKRGGTSTRGHKGAKSRSGYSRKVGFEGGQQPLQRRVPKFGFTNPNRLEYKPVNLDTLQALVDSKN